jgi:hypothetical protein
MEQPVIKTVNVSETDTYYIVWNNYIQKEVVYRVTGRKGQRMFIQVKENDNEGGQTNV